MYQLVSVGDITIDMYFQGESLTQEDGRFSLAIGGKYYPEMFHSGLGGSAANLSIHASNLGLDAATVATVGENSFKNIIVQALIKKSVSTEFLHFERDYTSISTILLSPQGERTIIKYTDPNEHINLTPHALDRIKSAGIVFMGNLPDVSVPERTNFLKGVKAESNIVAINFGGKDCEKGAEALKGLLLHVDCIFLNKYEFAQLIKKDPEKLDLATNHFKTIAGSQRMIVITDGENGAYVYTQDEVKHQPASKVARLVDATGAGDAFAAAFLTKYAEAHSIDEALVSASDYAAKQLSSIGAN